MVYEILDDNGNVINAIVADESFVSARYSNYRLRAPVEQQPPSKEEIEREWRNSQLTITDRFVPLTDHPQHADYLAYRQALRDWPATQDFPDTRPTFNI